MGIADQEKAIMEELKKLSNEDVVERESIEDVIKDDEKKDDGDDGDLEEIEDEEEEDDGEALPEIKEEPEENLTGAKFRHKLKAEKEARLLLERELAELKLAQARQQGREEAQAATKKIEVVAEEIPDQEYEPEKFAIYKTTLLEKKLQAMEEAQARSMAERQWEDLQVKRAKSNPHYSEAKAFLLENETKRAKSLYPTASNEQIEAYIKQQEYATVGNAAKAGIDPLQHIEFLAWQSGYRPSENKEELKRGSNIDNIKKNAKKSASLIGGSSSTKSNTEYSTEKLSAMTMKEIYKMGVDKYEEAIRKIEERS